MGHLRPRSVLNWRPVQDAPPSKFFRGLTIAFVVSCVLWAAIGYAVVSLSLW